MTEKQINIAIATYRGYTDISEDYCLGTRPNSEGEKYRREIIPRYAVDLNAMHGAAKSFDLNQKNRYLNLLIDLVTTDQNEDSDTEREFDWVEATAAQRAEAFLRTVGLWKEAE